MRVVQSEVLVDHDNPSRKLRPVVERDEETAKVIFRFAERWLDRLLLCFPRASISDGISEVLGREEAKRLAALPMPDYKFHGFRGEFWGDFQAQGAHQIVKGHIKFLADEMGLGKTFQVLAALSRKKHKANKKGRKFRVVIFVPNNAKMTWSEAIEEFFDFTHVVIDTQTQTFAERQRLIESDAEIVIVNIEGMRAKPIHEDFNPRKNIIGWKYANPALFVKDSFGQTDWYVEDTRNLHGDLDGAERVMWDFVVVDEHHRVKTPNAQATNGFFQVKGADYLFMSGTPILNRPEEIWTTLHKLWPTLFPSFDNFCKVLQVRGESDKVIGYSPDAMAELRAFLQQVTLRRRKEQVRKDLPEVVDLVHKVELTGEQRALYEQVKDEFLLVLEGGEQKQIMGVLPQITRLKQAAFSPELYGGSKRSAKIEKLKEIVQQLVDNGEKAIIFSQWKMATQIIRRELAEYNPAYVTGEVTSMHARHAEQVKFRTDPTCKLYIGTIGANRESVNLGTATYVIFTDLDWVPAGKDQAVGRSAAGGLRGVHLEGQDVKVHVIELQAEDTIEEWIQDLLAGKRAVASRMTERDAGRQIRKIEVSDIARMLRSEGKGKKKAG